MLNAQPTYCAQPPLRLMTGNLPVNAYYAEPQYDSEPHSDNYMLSPATPLTPSDPYGGGYGLQDSHRQWPQYSGGRYVPPYPRYPTYDSAPFMTELPTRTRSAMMDSSGGVFSTHGLQTSLPASSVPNCIPGGRDLPLPLMGARSYAQAYSHEVQQSRPHNYPKDASWLTSSGPPMMSARRGSLTNLRSAEPLAPPSSRSTTTTTTASDNSPLSVLPCTTDSSDTSSAITKTKTTPHNVVSPGLPQQSTFAHEHEPIYGLPTASVSDSRLPATAPTGQYTFSIARRNTQPNVEDDHQIGDPSAYVPLQYPPEHSTSRTYSLGSTRHGSIDNRMHSLTHRNSMPSMTPEAQ
jgi:hypothetical protein